MIIMVDTTVADSRNGVGAVGKSLHPSQQVGDRQRERESEKGGEKGRREKEGNWDWLGLLKP